MKIVVFGPFKRTGALHDESVVDLSYAYAKYLHERKDEPNPLEMADVVVPSDLALLIEGGPRALEAGKRRSIISLAKHRTNLDQEARCLFTGQRTCAYTPRGLVTPALLAPAETSPTTLRPWP
jgi:hypothetical protein